MPECRVCSEVFSGRYNANTCPSCLSNGVKWCSLCNQVKALTDYTIRRDGRVFAWCKSCYARKRLIERHTDIVKLEAYRRAARECDARKYATPEGRQSILDRNHARRASLHGHVSTEQWLTCLEYFQQSCAYCGKTGELTVEHIIPVSKFGANKIYNVVPACRTCNCSKCDKDILEWYPKQPFYTEERLLKIHSWFKDMQKEVV